MRAAASPYDYPIDGFHRLVNLVSYETDSLTKRRSLSAHEDKFPPFVSRGSPNAWSA